MVAEALGSALTGRGLKVVSVSSSVPEPLPKGTAAIKDAPIPKAKGGRQRVMSIAEAISRMRAMQLAREGRLPQARLGTGGGSTSAGSGFTLEAAALSAPERTRFALSQLEGLPELRGQATIPDRVPDEIWEKDPAVADYAFVVRFVMLWPAAGRLEGVRPADTVSYLAIGWHLLQMECYDLGRQKGKLASVWSATVQNVAFSSNLRWTLPRMARAAVEE